MPYCDPCDRYFNSDSAYWQHVRNSYNHYWCHACSRDFPSQHALHQHLTSSRAHASHECCWCSAFFFNQPDYNHHMQVAHHYCFTCSRRFGSARARDQHLQSDAHQPKTKCCPLCGEMFKTFSAVAAHVESSNCAGFHGDRYDLVRLIQQWEHDRGAEHALTKRGRITYPSTSTADMLEQCYVRALDAYICPRCPEVRRFMSLQNLRAHMESRLHAQNLYHCRPCAKEFPTLNALVLHWERSECGQRTSRLLGRLAADFGQLRLTF